MRRAFAKLSAERPLQISQQRKSELERRPHTAFPLQSYKELLKLMSVPRLAIREFNDANIQVIYNELMKEGKVILWLQSSKPGRIGHEVALLINRDGNIEYFDSEADDPQTYSETNPDLPDIDELLIALGNMSGVPITFSTIRLQGVNLELTNPHPSTCFPHCIIRLINSDLTQQEFYDHILKVSGGSFDAYALQTLDELNAETYLIKEGRTSEIPELRVPFTYEELRKAGYDDDGVTELREKEAEYERDVHGNFEYLNEMRREDDIGRTAYIKYLATTRDILLQDPNISEDVKEDVQDDFLAEYSGPDIPGSVEYATFDLPPRRMNIRAVYELEQRQEEKRIESDIKKLIQELEIGTEEEYERKRLQDQDRIIREAMASPFVSSRRRQPLTSAQMAIGGSEADLF